MSQQLFRKRRCDTCSKWSEGHEYNCPHCQAPMDLREHKRKLQLEAQQAEELRKKEEEALLPPSKRAGLKVLRAMRAFYMGIISFIAWLLFWLGG